MCVFSLLATTLAGYHLGQERTIVFDTGMVALVKKDELLDVNVTGLGCSDNATTTINLSSVAESLATPDIHNEDFFYTDVSITGLQNTLTVQGFAAVKKTKLGRYKYLPYRAEDIRKILSLTSRTNMTKQAMKFENLTLDLFFNASCSSVGANGSDVVWRSSELTDHELNLIMAILLETVSYNPFVKALDDYIICKLEVKYTDMPWVLSLCCGEAMHDIYDSDATRQHIRCHEPDQLRSMASHLAMLIGSISFLFSPLLLRCVPEDPYRRKKRAAGHRERRSPGAGSLKCCRAVDEGKADEANDDECGIEMQNIKRHRRVIL